MAPKLDIVYSRGRSKYVDPSQRLIGMSDDEQDLEYVPPGTQTPTPAARATRGTLKKVASGVVTASQSDEELIHSNYTSLKKYKRSYQVKNPIVRLGSIPRGKWFRLNFHLQLRLFGQVLSKNNKLKGGLYNKKYYF